MKKTAAIILAVMAVMLHAASAETPKTELFVFAAASLTETLTEIESVYETENPGIDLVFNFDSSGTLKTQITEGADCDVFISAARKQMDQLDIAADAENNPERLDYVLRGSRIDLLENKVALVVPEDNPQGIESFEELAEMLRSSDILMAMGNSDVPVGQYTRKILAYYGLDETELAWAGKLSYGSNVKEVTVQVAEGSVDCGVVYCTDAFSAGLDVKDTATPEMCGRVIYPAAVMKSSASPEASQAFIDYLREEEAKRIFEGVGFAVIPAEIPEK